jgi:hypothetical protein
MLQCQLLYKEAESLLSRNQTQLALEAFRTVEALLSELKARDKTFTHQVKRQIERIEDPVGFAARQQQLQVIAGNNKRLAQQQGDIDEISRSANEYYQSGHFEMAGNRYSQLITLLSEFKRRKPLALGHAFWNFAMSNISWASYLQLTDLNKAQLLKDQAKVQIQEAMLNYPSFAKNHLSACQAKLTELTTFLVQEEKSVSYIDVEEISTEQPIFAQPPLLHWKKQLLQRYLNEHPLTVSPTESTENNRNTCKI